MENMDLGVNMPVKKIGDLDSVAVLDIDALCVISQMVCYFYTCF